MDMWREKKWKNQEATECGEISKKDQERRLIEVVCACGVKRGEEERRWDWKYTGEGEEQGLQEDGVREGNVGGESVLTTYVEAYIIIHQPHVKVRSRWRGKIAATRYAYYEQYSYFCIPGISCYKQNVFLHMHETSKISFEAHAISGAIWNYNSSVIFCVNLFNVSES